MWLLVYIPITLFDACNHGVLGFNVLRTIKEDMLDRFFVETTGTEGARDISIFVHFRVEISETTF